MKMLLNEPPNNIKVSRRFWLLVLLGIGIKLSVGGLINFGKSTQNSQLKKQKIKMIYGFGSGNYGLNSYGI